MISYLIDVFLCGMVVVAELVVTIIFAIAVEVIVYKIFKINLYQEIWKSLNKLDRKLNRILEMKGGKESGSIYRYNSGFYYSNYCNDSYGLWTRLRVNNNDR